MQVILAEKPSVARDIARYVGATTRQDGYIEGNGYQVTWAFGHLVTLADTSDYGIEGKWNLNELPIIPNPMKLVVGKNEGVIKQYETIKSLFLACTNIIVATDAGREGELIFRYIYELSGCKIPFQRLWVSSLTDKALKDGFKNLKDGKDFDNLYYSAKARSEADWIVGINATRGLTLFSKQGKLLSLGRVQTPTLSLICKRFLENKNFVPTAYFVPTLQLQANSFNFVATFEKTLPTKEAASEIIKEIGKTLTCTDIKVKDIIEQPPTLFDLTTLQQVANKRFGLSAQQTLDIAQALYEKHKILSYPRTSSSYLSDDIAPNIQPLMQHINSVHPATTIIQEIIANPLSRRPIDTSKVTDHHAIIPTEQRIVLSNLTEDEKKVYFLVLDRFVAAFYKPCLKQSTQLFFGMSKGNFKSQGMVIKDLGWRAVSQVQEEDDEKTTEDNQKLPLLKIQQIVDVLAKKITDKKTTAPPLLTEASLLALMETAGKLVEDDTLKQSLKECGLGTPATRASTIETLQRRQYIALEGKKKLIPTDIGLQVYEMVKDWEIAKPDLTGNWEKKLNLMAAGNYNLETFNTEIRNYIHSIIGVFKSGTMQNMTRIPAEHYGECPKCKKGKVIEGKKGYGCSEFRVGCNFVIWKEIAGKTISPTMLRNLITKGKTQLLKGFMSKLGKPFDATMTLNQDFRVEFILPPK